MKKIIVHTQPRSYPVFIEKGLGSTIAAYFKKLNLGNFCLLITNHTIYSLHRKTVKKMLAGVPHAVIFVPDGEKAKTEEWAFTIIRRLISLDTLKRTLFVACLGGGVIGDLGAFAASLYKRGIPLVHIPTTLLAQIDASIGGKTAVDFKRIKNIVGTFYQPRAVFIDPLFLSTLPYRQMQQGIAEAIKYGVIKSRQLFESLRENHRAVKNLRIGYLEKVIHECVSIKGNIVACDEKEKKGVRTILNFGHTIAHALEGAGRFDVSHGEAVALGMIAAAHISYYLGTCPQKIAPAISKAVSAYKLPVQTAFSRKTLLATCMYDKKFIHGSIRMVVIARRIGAVKVIENVPLSIVEKSLQHIAVK